ncbi:MAG: hypothetical protein J0I48_19065 [Devosia sp.]|uniref:DNA-primase RepB domain-containing protein n=1 Tax=Devosia sp. 66-22 TaxID=1895753 RepID=UPI00092C734B|nr:DNA-primase RepB domain-containing protein [Devosia sp. 66-22]MBN9348267.1 hypothetical protein [Devosia sp.]OJX48992.1 MAG: hypothetical protein BGO81_10380 [Devosia sp. 66-22]
MGESPTLNEIVAAIFGPDFDPKTIHFASFPGDPHNKDDARWHGHRLTTGDETLPKGNNNFLCMGALDPTKTGRSLADVTHHVAFWMDDVGTKVPLERVKQLTQRPGMAPVLIIETSPGNYSYIWRLDKAVEELPDDFDAQTVTAIRHTLKADGWGDPAAQDHVRYMRLPGINGKTAYRQADGAPFQSRVVEWSPSNVVRLEDFAAAIMGATWFEDVRSGRFAPAQVLAGASNDRAATMDDPLVRLALAVGLSPQPSTRAGVIDCICPNGANHTGGDQTGYAIINDGMSYCNHASCQHLRSPDFQDMMIEAYDAQVQAGIMFGTIVENPLGVGLLDAKTGEVVPATGTGFLASVRFENAAVDTGMGSAGQSLVEAAEEVALRMSDAEDARYQYVADRFVAVDQTGSFWDLKYGQLIGPDLFDRDGGVLQHFKLATGKNRASTLALNHHSMRHVQTLACRPGEPVITTTRGPKGDPIPAVNTYAPANIRRVTGVPQKYLDHLGHMFAGQQQTVDYWLDYQAWRLQNPGAHTSIIALFGGNPGTGKDFLLEQFFKMVGQHNVGRATVKELMSEFNEAVLLPTVYLDEFSLAGKDAQFGYNKLKSLASPTGVSITINPKYGKKFKTQVSTSVLASTNDTDSLEGVGTDDRRFFIAWTFANKLVGQHPVTTPMSEAYFQDLWDHYEQPDSIGILYDFLMKRNVQHFNPMGAPPRSAARHSTLVASLSTASQFVYDLVTAGPLANRKVISSEEVRALALASDDPGVKNHTSPKALARGLQAAGCVSINRAGSDNNQVRVSGGQRVRLWSGACVVANNAQVVGAVSEQERDVLLGSPDKARDLFEAEVAASGAEFALT